MNESISLIFDLEIAKISEMKPKNMKRYTQISLILAISNHFFVK